MSFKHPLARDAKVCHTAGAQGAVRQILVIVTSLELDASHKRFDKRQVDRLTRAAEEWLDADNSGTEDFLLMNRPKKWIGDKD